MAHAQPSATPIPATSRHAARAGGALGQRLVAALNIVATLLIVVAPLYAWLIALCLAQRQSPSQAAAPLWFLLAEALLAWVVGRGLRGARTLAHIAAAFAPILACYIALVVFSPASTATVLSAFSSVGIIYAVFLEIGPNPTNLGLLAVVVYVWWASASDSASLPDSARVLRRFFMSIGASVAATLFLLAATLDLRAMALWQFAALLVALGFFGLLALTLSMISVERQALDVDPIFLRSQGRQLRWAALLAGAVVALALGIMLATSPELLYAIFVRSGLAALLALLAALFAMRPAAVFFLPPDAAAPEPTPPGKLIHHATVMLTAPPPAAYLLLALACLTLAALAFAIVRAILLARRRERQPDPDEEREPLDGWRLLRAQVRSLLHLRQRLPDAVAPGGMRALYRGLLLQAASHGLPREPQQTPQEYETRLHGAPPFDASDAQPADDLREVSEAYARARYAQREPPPAQFAALRERTQRLRALLRRRQ